MQQAADGAATPARHLWLQQGCSLLDGQRLGRRRRLGLRRGRGGHAGGGRVARGRVDHRAAQHRAAARRARRLADPAGRAAPARARRGAVRPGQRLDEAWIGEGAAAACLYVGLTWGNGLTDAPPAEGVSEVRCFPRHGRVRRVRRRVGLRCEDDRLRARIRGTAVELVVGGASAWLLRDRADPQAPRLAEGSRCELVPFDEYVDEDEAAEAGSEDAAAEYPFDEDAWPHTLAFILDPGAARAAQAGAPADPCIRPR